MNGELRPLDADAAGIELVELLEIVASAPGFALCVMPDIKGSRDVLVGWRVALWDRRDSKHTQGLPIRGELGWVQSLADVGELREALTSAMLDAPRRVR